MFQLKKCVWQQVLCHQHLGQGEGVKGEAKNHQKIELKIVEETTSLHLSLPLQTAAE